MEICPVKHFVTMTDLIPRASRFAIKSSKNSRQKDISNAKTIQMCQDSLVA